MPINWSDNRFIDADVELDDDDRATMEACAGEHPTVPVAVWSTERMAAAIDVDVAEMVYLLWKNGITTESACQDSGPNHDAIVDFRSVDDLAAFLTIVAPEDGTPGGIWDRATGSNLDTSSAMWGYLFFPRVTGRRPEFPVAVLFPRADIPELVERLRPVAGSVS